MLTGEAVLRFLIMNCSLLLFALLILAVQFFAATFSPLSMSPILLWQLAPQPPQELISTRSTLC